jgi:tetratricopeptide (TPR) repeat protein
MPHGYSYLALALRQLERDDEALAVLRKALALGLEREQLRRQLGQTLAEMGRSEEAIRALSPLRETGEPESRIALAGALSDAGRADEAMVILDRLVKEDPRNPRVYETLGVAEMRRDRPAEARRQLERALELNDRLPGAWNTLGVARYQLQDRAGALAAWRRAIELDARRYDTLYNLALVSAEAGDVAGAKQALRQFLDTAPPARFAADLEKARRLLGDLQKQP